MIKRIGRLLAVCSLGLKPQRLLGALTGAAATAAIALAIITAVTEGENRFTHQQ